MKTEDLIIKLGSAPARKPLRSPLFYIVILALVLGLYACGMLGVLGLRPDLPEQLLRPAFVCELALLGLLAISGVLAAAYAMYPDEYQKSVLIKVPYAVVAVLLIYIPAMMFMQPGAPVTPESHGVECALSIAAFAVFPSFIIFWVLQKGCSTKPLQAGCFAVLTAVATSGLMMRLIENVDDVGHLVLWHYLPTLVFAALGAVIGHKLLRW